MDDLSLSAVSMTQDIMDGVLGRYGAKGNSTAADRLKQLWHANLSQLGVILNDDRAPKKRRIGSVYPSERLQEVVPFARIAADNSGAPALTMKMPDYRAYPTDVQKTSERKLIKIGLIDRKEKVVVQTISDPVDVVIGMSVQVCFAAFVSCFQGSLEANDMTAWHCGHIIGVNRSTAGLRKIIGVRIRLHCPEFRGEFDSKWPTELIKPTDAVTTTTAATANNSIDNEMVTLLDNIADDKGIFHPPSSSTAPKIFDVLDLLLGDDDDVDDLFGNDKLDDDFHLGSTLESRRNVSEVIHNNSSLLDALEPLDIPGSSSSSFGNESRGGPDHVRLATGESIPAHQVAVANAYGLQWTTKRPRVELVPGQTNRSYGELKNIAVDPSILSPDEDPSVVSGEPETVVLGRLSQLTRQKNSNKWSMTLFDVYVRENDSVEQDHDSSSSSCSSKPANAAASIKSRDFIVPIVKVSLDGQELFTEENTDAVYPTNNGAR